MAQAGPHIPEKGGDTLGAEVHNHTWLGSAIHSQVRASPVRPAGLSVELSLGQLDIQLTQTSELHSDLCHSDLMGAGWGDYLLHSIIVAIGN